MRTDCYILTQSSSDHSSTFAFWLGCSTVGHWGPKAFRLPLALNSASCPPTDSNWNSNWLPQAVFGAWLYNWLTPTCFLWAYASAPNSTTSTGQGDSPISSTGCTCFNIHRIHSTCGHGEISAITLLILSLSRCSCLNIHWYTAPVDMTTFRWSRRSYQSICQQHPPYSHPQVTLIYYKHLYLV